MDAPSRIRPWRTAFLTLRDEALCTTSSSSLPSLLRNLTLQSDMIMPAASVLPHREVASDVLLLVELTSSVPVADDTAVTLLQICSLIYDISHHAKLEFNLSSCFLVMEFLDKIITCFASNIHPVQHFGTKKTLMEALHILGELVDKNGGNWSSSLTSRLVKLLVHLVSFLHVYLTSQPYSHIYHDNAVAARTKLPLSENLREVQTIAFNMLGDAFSRTGSSVSDDMWTSALEVLRSEMDTLSARKTLIEESAMSKYYASVLRCLHLILADRRAPVSDHIAGFVAALKLFFTYGVARTSSFRCSNASSNIVEHDVSKKSIEHVPKDDRSEHGRYRPPHLRKRETMEQTHNDRSGSFLSSTGYTTSDSEQSDSDGQPQVADRYRSSKARSTALICIQDLCQADPKSLSSQLSTLLPTNDVLQPCSYQPNLLTCLIFDPVLKTRMAAASALASLLDVSTTLFLQVAEFKEFPKFSSFTTLSNSLGQILMQLHSGLLYVIQHEKHCILLASAFKVLQLLLSATPYARMPGKVLPTVISSVQMKAQELFSTKTDETSLVAASIGCLGSAFSISPPSLEVIDMLKVEISTGKSGSILMLFQLAEIVKYPSICFEALQALKSLLHNYPDVMSDTWDKVSALTFGVSQIFVCDNFTTKITVNSSRVDSGNSSREAAGKCVVAAIKVLDEFLRVVSGFKGMDDHLDDRLLEAKSEFPRKSKVSSAPFFQEEVVQQISEEMSVDSIGSKRWSEAIEKHISPMLSHASAMVRAASITCFSGLTSSVFFTLTKEKQSYSLLSIISAALHDKVPSVRSSACRAVGVIACFQQISMKDLENLIHAVEANTEDELVSVRITAAWALANICDSLRCKASNAPTGLCLTVEEPDIHANLLSLVSERALRLTQDNDKVKANAVRALGNLSRFVDFMVVTGSDSQSISTEQASLHDLNGNHIFRTRFRPRISGSLSWLERMVQAFVSCVTTGNVKVQWNVCHALANLFLNETLVLHDMPWTASVYSILLLLLRDSSNFKIRIHAAAALAVPASRSDYGSFFPDVLQGIELVLEAFLHSDHITTPSSFKYRDALEEQLTSTMLHVLSFVSDDEPRPLKDFLIKKADFLEEWISSMKNTVSSYPSTEISMTMETQEPLVSADRRKGITLKALRSLIQLYGSCNNQSIAETFQKLIERLPDFQCLDNDLLGPSTSASVRPIRPVRGCLKTQ